MRSAARPVFGSFGDPEGDFIRKPEMMSRSELAGLTRTEASAFDCKSGPSKSSAEMTWAVPPSSVTQKKELLFAPTTVRASAHPSRKLMGVGESWVGCVADVALEGRVQICQIDESDFRKAKRESSGDQNGCLRRPRISSEVLPEMES